MTPIIGRTGSFSLSFQWTMPSLTSTTRVLIPNSLLPHPVGEDADARPERAEAEALELHVEDLDGQHVAGLRTLDLDRAGGAVDEGQRDVARA